MRIRLSMILLAITWVVSALAAEAPGTSAGGALQGNRYAILVGINEYMDSGILKLTTPRTDAYDMAKALQGLGWDKVFVMADDLNARSVDFPTRSNIEKRVNLLAELSGKNDTIMLFFSGHGISVGGEDRFLPVDADLNRLKETGLPISNLVKVFTSKGIAKVVLAVDACRESVTATKGLSVVGVSGASSTTGNGPALALYATQAGWFSYEDRGGRNSVFTKYLMEGLLGQAAEARGVGSATDVTAGDLSRWLPGAVGSYALDQGIRQKPVAILGTIPPEQLILGRGTPRAPQDKVAGVPTAPPTTGPTGSTTATTPGKIDPLKKIQYVKLIQEAVEARDTGNIAKSMGTLDTALALLPSEAQGYYEYGIALEMKNEPETAYGWFLKAAELKPNLRDVNVHLGRMLQWLGLFEDSIPYFEKEIELYPDNPWAREIYAEMLVWGIGDAEAAKKAIALLGPASAQDPKNPYISEHLGKAYQILKDGPNMVKHYNAAIAIYQEGLKDPKAQRAWDNFRDRIARLQKANAGLPAGR